MPAAQQYLTNSRSNNTLPPFDARDWCTTVAAAALAGVHPSTVRRWASDHSLGRMVGGRIRISIPALRMFIDGDAEALQRYRRGERDHPCVAAYLDRSDALDASDPRSGSDERQGRRVGS